MTFRSEAAAVVSAIIGVGLFGYGLDLRRKLRSSQRWPEATGTVTQSDLDRLGDGGYQLSVTYEYTVDGTGFSSRRVKFGDPKTYERKSSAEEAMGRYPANSRLTFYYDPENPADSVLDRTSSGGIVYLIAGVIFLFLMAAIIMHSFRNTAPTQ